MVTDLEEIDVESVPCLVGESCVFVAPEPRAFMVLDPAKSMHVLRAPTLITGPVGHGCKKVQILEINSAFAEYLGYTRKDLVGQDPQIIKPEFCHTDMAEVLCKFCKRPAGERLFWTHHHKKDGTTVKAQVHSQVIVWHKRPAVFSRVFQWKALTHRPECIRGSDCLRHLTTRPTRARAKTGT